MPRTRFFSSFLACRSAAELVVAVQEVGDGANSHDDTAAGQLAVDLGDAPMFDVAKPTDGGDDVEAELVMRQGEVGFGLGPVGSEEAGTREVVAAADSES